MNQKGFANINIVLVVVGVIVLFAGVVGYFLFIQKPEPAASTTAPAAVDKTANWQAYRNEELGIYFSYPEYWGEVKVKLIQAPLVGELFKGEVVSGRQAELSFTNNPQVWITFSSPDYKEIKVGSEGMGTDIISYFIGQEEQLICQPLPPFGTTQMAECNSLTINGSLAVEGYIINIIPGDCYTLFKDVKIVSPNQNFPGVNITTSGIPAITYLGCEKEIFPKLTPADFGILRIKELKEGKLPIEARQFLVEFDNFIQSIEFIK